jgi:hypothetical protein
VPALPAEERGTQQPGPARGWQLDTRHSATHRAVGGLVKMTAYCGPDLKQFVRGGGVDAVVEKPFGLEDMLQLNRRPLVTG